MIARCTRCQWREEGDERPILQHAHSHANRKGHPVELDEGRTIRPISGEPDPGDHEQSISAQGFRAIAENYDASWEDLRRALRAAAERINEAVMAGRATRLALEREVGRQRASTLVARERTRLTRGDDDGAEAERTEA